MKTLIALLLLCSVSLGATLNIHISIPGVVTNAPGTIDGIGTKTSEYPNKPHLDLTDLFLIADPVAHTNDNITYNQLLTVVAGGITNVINAYSLTNLHYAYVTNSVPSTGSLVFGGNAYQTNLQADITLGLFSSVSPYFYETTILYATNSTGSDHTITGPNGSVGPNGVAPASIICTNKHMTRILVEHYGRDWTNMSKLDL